MRFDRFCSNNLRSQLAKILNSMLFGRVTACNLAHVPLPNASLDVAVFCLALMGTDWIKFVEEAMQSSRTISLLMCCALPEPYTIAVDSRFRMCSKCQELEKFPTFAAEGVVAAVAPAAVVAKEQSSSIRNPESKHCPFCFSS